MRTGVLLIVGLLLVAFSLAGPARAQDSDQLLQAVDKLEAEFNALRQEVAQLRRAQAGASQDGLVQIVNEIEYLKAELAALHDVADQQQVKLASLDDEGFYIPDDSDRMEEMDDRLSAIDQRLEQSLGRLDQSQPSNPSVGHGSIKFSGLIHQYFTAVDGSNSSFQTSKVRLGIGGPLNDYASYTFIGEFANNPKLIYGFLTVSPHETFSVRLGQFKALFCTDFLRSSAAMPFVSASMASALGPRLDIGAAASYRRKVSDGFGLKLSAGVFNGAGANTTDANSNKNLAARAEFKLGNALTLAPSFNSGKTNQVDSLKESRTDYSASLTWNWHNEIVEAEYVQSKVGDVESNGWYAYAGHSFDLGTRFVPQIQLLARYEQMDPDLDIDDNLQDKITVGTNLFIDNKFTKLQLNYSLKGAEGDSDRIGEFQVNGQVAF